MSAIIGLIMFLVWAFIIAHKLLDVFWWCMSHAWDWANDFNDSNASE